MLEKKLEKNIELLGLDEESLKILIDNNIITIKDLWLKKRMDLKNINLSDNQINKIIIKMQLFGLDLNQKVYKNS